MAADPNAVANKWKNRLQQSTQEVQAGVQRVTVAPGQKAAAASATWLARLQASQPKWARNVAAVSLQDWQRAMIEKGVPRIAQGAEQSVGKVERFMQDFLPHVERGRQMVQAMPKVSLQDGINRAVAMINHNAQFKRNA